MCVCVCVCVVRPGAQLVELQRQLRQQGQRLGEAREATGHGQQAVAQQVQATPYGFHVTARIWGYG